jgi:hypothetical protein
MPTPCVGAERVTARTTPPVLPRAWLAARQIEQQPPGQAAVVVAVT